MIDVEVVELPGGAVSAKSRRVGVNLGLPEQATQIFKVLGRHILLDAIGAKAAGLDLPATELLVFGNPKLGTPLMQTNRKIGLDLPMKALAWKDAAGKVQLVVNTPRGRGPRADGQRIRMAATANRVPCLTTAAAARATARGLAEWVSTPLQVRSLQEFHAVRDGG